MKHSLVVLALFVFAVGCNEDRKRIDRDNTGVNERDADGGTKTVFDQSNSQPDIDLTAKIRTEVLEIEDLSINGRNVKIISNEGKVVLRGPVASASERDAIEKVAVAIAGSGKVTNNLEVEKD